MVDEYRPEPMRPPESCSLCAHWLSGGICALRHMDTELHAWCPGYEVRP